MTYAVGFFGSLSETATLGRINTEEHKRLFDEQRTSPYFGDERRHSYLYGETGVDPSSLDMSMDMREAQQEHNPGAMRQDDISLLL